MKAITYCLFLWLLMASCQKESQHITRINKEDFTVEEQLTIGLVLKEALESDQQNVIRLSRDGFAEAYQYLDQMMVSILQSAKVERRKTFDWNITILDDDTMRTAFTLPGGHIYVYTGLLKILNTEHQLVGILAHEVGYADTDALINRLKSEYGGVYLGDILLDNIPDNITTVAANISELQFEEQTVLEADAFAVNLLCPYGWNAKGIKSLLEQSERQEEEIQWLSTRVGNHERRKALIDANAAACGVEESTFTERYLFFKETYLP